MSEEPPGIIKQIIKEIMRLRYISSKAEYRKHLENVKSLWMSYEPEFPIYTDEEIRKIVRERVGKVDFDRCVRVSKVLGKSERPLRFTEILEEIRNSPEFEKIGDNSLNKTLARTLNYLTNAGLVAKCCRVTLTGREVDTYYFRLFRIIKKDENPSCKKMHCVA